jgi:hypothetical protein
MLLVVTALGRSNWIAQLVERDFWIFLYPAALLGISKLAVIHIGDP